MRTLPLSLVFCALLGAAGVACSSGSSSQNWTNPASAYSTADSQTIFRGIYFADGAAASLSQHWDVQSAESSSTDTTSPAYTAATLHDLAAAYTKAGWTTVGGNLDAMADQVAAGTVKEVTATAEVREKNIDLLLSLIDKGDTTFFDRFKSEVTSGDEVQVSDAIQEGTRRVLAAMSLVGAANARAAAKARRGGATKDDGLVTGGGSIVNGGSALVDGGAPLVEGDGGSLVDNESANTGLVNSEGMSPGSDPDSMQMPQQQASLYVNIHIAHDSIAVTDKIAAVNAALFWATPNENAGSLGTASYVHVLAKTLKKP